MKKHTIAITSLICGGVLLCGCTQKITPANVSKSLEHNLNVLKTTINRLDTIDNSYLSNPDIYPITNNTLSNIDINNYVASITSDKYNLTVPIVKNKNKLAFLSADISTVAGINDSITAKNIGSINTENNANSNLQNESEVADLQKENASDENVTDLQNETENQTATNIIYYDARPVRYAPRYSKNSALYNNDDYLTNYIDKVRILYAITNDAIEANNTLNDAKNSVITYVVEIKELNTSIKDGTFKPNSQQITALNNYINDIKRTIKRIKKCNGDLSNEVNTINKTNVGGIAAGIDVINSNYICVLNHLDTRITYLKNSLTTLEHIKALLLDVENLLNYTDEEVIEPDLNIDSIIEQDAKNKTDYDANLNEENLNNNIDQNIDNNLAENDIDNNIGENIRDDDFNNENFSDNNDTDNIINDTQIDKNIDTYNDNTDINMQTNTDNNDIANSNDRNIDLYDDEDVIKNVNDENTIDKENATNQDNINENDLEKDVLIDDTNNKNIDTYINNSGNLDTYSGINNDNIDNPNNNINNSDTNNNSSYNNSETNYTNNNYLNNDNANVPFNNNNINGVNNNGIGSAIPLPNDPNRINTPTGTFQNGIITQNNLNNGIGSAIPLPNDPNRINTPTGTFQNGIITQNNLNNGTGTGANGIASGFNGSSNGPYINGDINRTNKNTNTYGYNTMIDMINRGTVNNGINTLSISENASVKPSMVNNNIDNCEECELHNIKDCEECKLENFDECEDCKLENITHCEDCENESVNAQVINDVDETDNIDSTEHIDNTEAIEESSSLNLNETAISQLSMIDENIENENSENVDIKLDETANNPELINDDLEKVGPTTLLIENEEENIDNDLNNVDNNINDNKLNVKLDENLSDNDKMDNVSKIVIDDNDENLDEQDGDLKADEKNVFAPNNDEYEIEFL